MDPLVATLVLILLSLLGARLSFSTEQVPPGPRLLFRTGTHFLFLGFLLGPGSLGLVSAEAVDQLLPLLALGLGWIGLLFGMQLDRESLGQFPLGLYVLMLGQAVVTWSVFLGIGWLVLVGSGLGGPGAPILLMGAAATACVAAPAGVAMVSTNYRARGPAVQLLLFVASLDALVGIIALQITYSLFHPVDARGFAGSGALTWVALALGLGVVCGILFLWLLRRRPPKEELTLYLLGMAALGSGAALQLSLSPLFVCVVMGALVTNLTPARHRVFQALQNWEKPIYMVFLLLAGALLTLPTWWLIPLAVAYSLVRVMGKWAGFALFVPLARAPVASPHHLGLGLVPQGGMSLAMAVSVVLTYSGLTLDGGVSGVDLFFSVVVLGVVASELAGPWLTTGVLRSAGAILPLPVDAPEPEVGTNGEAPRDPSRNPGVEPDS